MNGLTWSLFDCMKELFQKEENKMNDDMKYGYNVCGQRLNEEIDTMIDEVHNAYMK
jgi:hypothetical protein